jgi:hypothetical protein
MADDYAYQQTRLRPKPEGPFGFGGKAALGFGSRTTQGSGDAGPGGGSGMAFFGSSAGGGGFNFNGGYSDGGGSPGGTNGGSAGGSGGGGGGGGGGSLPNGNAGSLLRHNGSDWVAIGPPGGASTEGLLVNSSDSYYYVNGNDLIGLRSVCIFNGNNWVSLTAPEEGTHVLGIVDNQIKWLETESCNT